MEAFKEQILNFRKLEFATTLRVLRAYPEERLDLKPAEKSRTARELIQTLVREEFICRGAMRGDIYANDAPERLPEGLDDLLGLLRQTHDEVQGLIARAGDEEMSRVLDFYGYGLRALDVLWLELHDQIHHRGQFSIYLRLAGAKVPSIYGPTADEPAGAA
jgi:uncharacterized damage-inducible protein DinB